MKKVSELLNGLTGILEGQVRPRITDNMPHTPTAILYAGEAAFAADEDILDTLHRVWRGRTDALCRLVMKDGAYYLPGEEGSLTALDDAAVQGQIDDMFAEEQSFRTMNGLLLAAIINTADYTDLEQFRNAYMAPDHLKEQLGMSACNTMKIVMLDESGRGRALANQIRVWLREALGSEDPAARTTVILSNRLKNGVLLAGDRIHENYALAANMILLANGSNSEFSPKYSRMFSTNQLLFVTASYSRIRKPTRKICEILINTTLKWVDARFRKGELLSSDDISKALSISGGKIAAVDRFFQQNVLPNLPKNEVLEYLPRNSANLDAICVLPFAEYDRLTMGAFEPFYQSDVLGKLCSERNVKQFREQFLAEIRSKFTPSEAARSITAQTVDQVLRQIPHLEVSAAKPVHQYMRERIQNDYTHSMLPVCADALKFLAASAKAHMEQITEIIQEFQHSYMLDVDKTLEEYYTDLTRDKLEGDLGDQLLGAFNRPNLGKEGMLQALYDTISMLFTSDKIFGMPLEQEMTLRMGGSGKQVQNIIQEELTDGLSERIRLQTAIVPEITFETILVNQKDDDDREGRLYNYLSGIFTNADCLDTGNSNSIEFIQLYVLDAHIL